VGGHALAPPTGLRDAEPLPDWLEGLIDGLVSAGVFPAPLRPNHVLVNEYLAGQGILPHTDGPSYHPCVATLSLGTPCIMRYQARAASTPVCAELVLRPRSLVVTAGAAYSDCMHSIAAADEEVVEGTSQAPCLNLDASGSTPGEEILRGRRISLTIRHVPARDRFPSLAGEGGGGGQVGEGSAAAAAAAAAAEPVTPSVDEACNS
jgi:alkylated DNA repair protein alkB homolog 6